MDNNKTEIKEEKKKNSSTKPTKKNKNKINTKHEFNDKQERKELIVEPDTSIAEKEISTTIQKGAQLSKKQKTEMLALMGNIKLSPNPSKNKQKEDEITNINNEMSNNQQNR